VLARRSHTGPLRVQRDLYPEGERTCHSIVVHPPGGIAGGDSLSLKVDLGPDSAALLTTPGAGKWYGSDGAWAAQALQFEVASGAVLEWLPQETIVFNRALAGMATSVRLQEGAIYVGWEILCLGRAAAGERFARGCVRQRIEILQDGVQLWVERGRTEGGDPLLASPIGLAGRTVCATLIAAGRDLPDDVLAACRTIAPGEGALGGITRLPRLAVARYLGDSGEDARRYFASLWGLLRPALKGCAAVTPRIWTT
jgi:urease accessory protein